MPSYRHATYAGESLTLANDHLRLDVHRRVTGWGWVEVFTAGGRLLGVLDHFGEILLRDQEIPMRLEAASIEQGSGESGQFVRAEVASLIVFLLSDASSWMTGAVIPVLIVFPVSFPNAPKYLEVKTVTN